MSNFLAISHPIICSHPVSMVLGQITPPTRLLLLWQKRCWRPWSRETASGQIPSWWRGHAACRPAACCGDAHGADTLNATVLLVASSGPCETLWVTSAAGVTGPWWWESLTYRPPSSSLSDSLDDQYSQLRLVTCAGTHGFILGDFNINILRPTESCVRRYLSMLSDLNLNQLVTEPTREGFGEPCCPSISEWWS